MRLTPIPDSFFGEDLQDALSVFYPQPIADIAELHVRINGAEPAVDGTELPIMPAEPN